MAQRNTSLRVLSVAYANGRLTSDQYQTLRNQQLSAIEFDKAPPPIPAELNNIEIPTVNVDPLRMQSATSKNSKRMLLSLAAVLLVISTTLIAVMVWQHMPTDTKTTQDSADEPPQPRPIAQASAASIVTHNAMQLIKSDGNNAEALDAFYSHWQQLNAGEQTIQRESPWADELGHALQQSLRDTKPGSRRQKILSILGWLGVTLQEAPSAKQADSSENDPVNEDQPEPSPSEGAVSEPEQASTAPNPEGNETDKALQPEKSVNPEQQKSGQDSSPPAPSEPEKKSSDDTAGNESLPQDEGSSSQEQPVPTNDSEAQREPAPENATEEDEPPGPSDSGYNTSPEYEPEPEFGKEARDAILGDTPGY